MNADGRGLTAGFTVLLTQSHSDETDYPILLQDDPASFDKLRMRCNLRGTKKDPHPEPVEGRNTPIQVSCKQLTALVCGSHRRLTAIA